MQIYGEKYGIILDNIVEYNVGTQFSISKYCNGTFVFCLLSSLEDSKTVKRKEEAVFLKFTSNLAQLLFLRTFLFLNFSVKTNERTFTVSH